MKNILAITFTLLSLTSFAYAEQYDAFEEFLVTEIELITERMDYFRQNCIESGLDVQTLYYMEGAKSEAQIVLNKYRDLRSCGDACPGR